MGTLHFFDAANRSKTDNSISLEKSINIEQLLKVEFSERDSKWVKEFLQNIDECVLEASSPEVAVANDGFPYVNLKTAEVNRNFKGYILKNEIDRLLKNGFGVVINAVDGHVDWLFSAGDILNYHLNQEFYTDESSFSAHGKDFVLTESEEILVGQPSEQILPTTTRDQLREFLHFSGVLDAQILLMARNHKSEEELQQDLVFNITPSKFSNYSEYENVMNTIAWFLPKHYSIVSADDEKILSGFQPL